MAEKPWEGSFNKLYVCMYVCMYENKLSHSHPQFPQSTPGTPGFLHRCLCCLLAAVTKFQGKLASLQQVSSPNSQDNFQICCADIYLVRFLANFAGFRVFL